MQKVCNKCHRSYPFVVGGKPGAKSGFLGNVCWGCVLEDQRAWRREESGGDYARAASKKAYAKRKASSLKF